MAGPRKRRNSSSEPERAAKKSKGRGKKPWRQGKFPKGIEAGNVGILASCSMGKEGKCAAELKDFFEEYAAKIYGDGVDDEGEKKPSEEDDEDEEVDIEAEIRREVEAIHEAKSQRLARFEHVKLETECVLFFRTRLPISPTSFVHRLCQDVASGAEQKQSRFVKRLTPITLFGKATEKGLQETAQQVLAPYFHQEDGVQKKFAIRPSFRNHKVLTRDGVIRAVAAVVGHNHKVDLKQYDLLIIVDVYQNVCGISVVESDYDRLRRYNLAELAEQHQNGAPSIESRSSIGTGAAGAAAVVVATDAVSTAPVKETGIAVEASTTADADGAADGDVVAATTATAGDGGPS